MGKPVSETNPLVRTVDVAMRYPIGDEHVDALRGVNMTVADGERLAIVGRSGSGKSTLLNVIGALERPTSGKVTFDGDDIGAQSDTQLANLRNRSVGFVFQHHHLLPQCTALENVLVPTLVTRGVGGKQARERAEHLLDRAGMGDRTSHRPGQLSGGQLQRVGLVRALINQPRLVLADEPTGSLDHTTADEIIALLLDLHAADRFALVMVTHDRELASKMDRMITLSDGQVVADDAT